MQKKTIALVFILLFMSSAMALAQPKKMTKRALKKAPVAAKKAPAAVKKTAPAPTAVPALVSAETTKTDEDKIADLKEETNKALTLLKAQIDTVKSDNSDAKIGGNIFFQWSRITQNNTKLVPNSFDVTRAYLNFTKKLAGESSMRITLDVKRVSDDVKNQNLFDYLKYAYFQTPLPVSALQFVPFNLNAKVGLQQNAWIDWDEGIMGMRYIMKSFLDDEGVMSSSDFGIGANGKVSLPAGVPEIEYNAVLSNGSGYATNEGDAKKALTVRVNSTVYRGPDLG